MTARQRPGAVVTLVLAAGASTRMGRPKQLAGLLGTPLLERVLSGLGPGDWHLVVALGAHAGEVRERAHLHGAAPVVVTGWAAGMGAVLAEAATALLTGRVPGVPHCAALVVCLGDQPLVGAAAVERLAGAWRDGAGPVVRATYQGRPGHPTLFDRRVLAHLTRLEGDRGARELLDRHPDWVAPVEVGDLGSDFDVDDEPALARAAELLRGHALAGGSR